MGNLYLIRGLPGSGKSTFAEQLQEATKGCHHEADDFFHFKKVESGGQTWTVWDEHYAFDRNKLYEAHKACKGWTEDCLRDGCKDVIVSNTFTTQKELQPYLDLAAEYGYRVTTLIVENRHGGVNVHDVPQETLDKMRNRFQVVL